MGRRRSARGERPIESYQHSDKERLNNPPVGLVTPDTDPDGGPRTYAYDPHLDPQLRWAGKAEHTSFEVPTVSLHVHGRIDTRRIMEAERCATAAGTGPSLPAPPQRCSRRSPVTLVAQGSRGVSSQTVVA